MVIAEVPSRDIDRVFQPVDNLTGLLYIEKAELTRCLNSFDRTMTACEIQSRYKGVLRKAVWACAGVLIAAGPAKAVDLVNRDKAPRDVTVNSADGSSQVLTVKAGEKVNDICSDCVILVGRSSVETKGRTTVKIEDGKVSIGAQR
jgi:hypothetical protein